MEGKTSTAAPSSLNIKTKAALMRSQCKGEKPSSKEIIEILFPLVKIIKVPKKMRGKCTTKLVGFDCVQREKYAVLIGIDIQMMICSQGRPHLWRTVVLPIIYLMFSAAVLQRAKNK